MGARSLHLPSLGLSRKKEAKMKRKASHTKKGWLVEGKRGREGSELAASSHSALILSPALKTRKQS